MSAEALMSRRIFWQKRDEVKNQYGVILELLFHYFLGAKVFLNGAFQL